MNELKAVLAALAGAALLVGCGSSSLTSTDAGPRDSIDRTGMAEASVGCTPGRDQTCDDDPTAATNWGACLSDGTCQCIAPCVNPVTGRCLTPSCACGALCLP